MTDVIKLAVHLTFLSPRLKTCLGQAWVEFFKHVPNCDVPVDRAVLVLKDSGTIRLRPSTSKYAEGSRDSWTETFTIGLPVYGIAEAFNEVLFNEVATIEIRKAYSGWACSALTEAFALAKVQKAFQQSGIKRLSVYQMCHDDPLDVKVAPRLFTAHRVADSEKHDTKPRSAANNKQTKQSNK
ncbi:MAG: hypothetical protein WKF77_16410 [Planctomycetaceae bacterium]